MSKEFLMPELAESVVEGEIVQWLVAEGDMVKADQPLVEVMTDKVTVELPSPYSGILVRQLVKEGDVVQVNMAIALFQDDNAATTIEENAAELEDDGDQRSLFKADKSATDEPIIQIQKKNAGQVNNSKITGPYGRVLAVPAARKLARDIGLDITSVSGSGPNGRIRVDDVKAHASKPSEPIQSLESSTVPSLTSSVNPNPELSSLEERIPVRGLRRAIAKQMLASHLETVRTLHVDEADLSSLVKLRTKLQPFAETKGAKLSYLPFIMKAVVSSLKAFPMINASLDEANNEIVRKHYYNLGLAVATDAGLLVPVVHDVANKSILDLAVRITDLASKARANKLSPEEVKGGTFSITNIGSLGGLFSFPIINVPEAAILGVHSIKKRPVVLEDDSIVAREMLYLSLSFDHRVIDGAEAAMFTSHLIKQLETPESLILEL